MKSIIQNGFRNSLINIPTERGRESLVWDFRTNSRKQMTKNFEQMKSIHQETNRVLSAHYEQLLEVRKYVDEVGQANWNEINGLKQTVNHFREQCNIRLENLETRTNTPPTDALGHR
ncbi:unnamed protein product, partial [Allacma fusca]